MPTKSTPNYLDLIQRTAVIVLTIIAVLLTGVGIYFIIDVIIILFLAYLIALGMSSVVNVIMRHTHFQRVVAAFIAYAITIALIITALFFILPNLTSQIFDLVKKFDLAGLTSQLNDIGLTMASIDSILSQLGNMGKPIISILSSAFSQTFRLFTLIVISFHMVLFRGQTVLRVANITKQPHLAKIYTQFMDLLNHKLGGWLRAELSLMLIMGIISYLGFLVIGIPFALPLGILTGLMEIVPTIGPVIAGIPAVAIAFSISPLTGIIALIFCIAIQQLENIFLVPKVMRYATGVHPLISIIAILIGLDLFGAVGALTAIPIYIILRTAYVFFVRDKKYLATKS